MFYQSKQKRMKKLLFLAALSSVALASCVSDESPSIDATPSGKAISFNAPVMYSQTKAEKGEQPDGSGHYSTNEKFRVYAKWTKGNDLATNTWALGEDYMVNVKTKYFSDQTEATTTGAWFPVNDSDVPEDYYWPKDGYLRFAAYSPADAHGIITYGATGLTVLDYETPAVGEQYDLMYSNRTSYCRGSSSDNHTMGYYEGVDLTFNHALSSIKFKVQQAEAYTGTELYLKKIEILYAFNKATFKENLVDATGSSAPEWSGYADRVKYEITNTTGSGTDIGQKLTTTATDVTVDAGQQNPLLLIPQNLLNSGTPAESISIKVTYSIKNPSNNVIEQTHTINLADTNNDGTPDYQQVQGTTTDIEKWERGKRYTYTINIALNRIYFNPIVENWTDVTPGDINI